MTLLNALDFGNFDLGGYLLQNGIAGIIMAVFQVDIQFKWTHPIISASKYFHVTMIREVSIHY